jgi:hypothetical protein
MTSHPPRSGMCFGGRESHTRPWRAGGMNGCRDGRDACPGGLGGADYVFRGAEFADGDLLKGAVFGVKAAIRWRRSGNVAEAPARSVPTPRGSEDQAAPSNRRTGLSSTAGGLCGAVAARRGGPRHSPECRSGPSGSSAMGSAALHARQLLLVFFGDCSGELPGDACELVERAGYRGEADALQRLTEILPGRVEPGPKL